nr:Ribonuclease H-like domain containing protein [Ipomoea batatas]
MVKHSKKSSTGSGLGNLGVSTGAKNRTDPGWNHCVEVVHDGEEKKAYKYVKCNYCEKVVKGGVSRLKHHLARTRVGVKPCDKVPEAVKQQFVDLLNKLKTKKNLAQMEFEQCVEVGSYFGSGREGEDEGNVASGGSVSNRGIRGPMDRYMVKGNSSGEQTTTIAPPQNAKELRQQLIPNTDDMEKADLQCSAFHSRERLFGLAQAKNTVHKRTPGENDEDAPHLSVDDLDVDVFEGEPSQATQTQSNESSSKKVSREGQLYTKDTSSSWKLVGSDGNNQLTIKEPSAKG